MCGDLNTKITNIDLYELRKIDNNLIVKNGT